MRATTDAPVPTHVLFDVEITCSGTPTKGIISSSECLECALHRENTCGYDYGLLRAMFKNSDRSGIHVTDLTSCLRKAYLDKAEPKPVYIHEKLVLTLGTAVHGFLEDSDDQMDCELPLNADGVVGTADLVYKNGRIVDYKTTRWLNPGNLPYGSHATQVNVYAHLLRKMGREVKSAAIQYIDMSGPSKCRKCKLPVRANHLGELLCPRCGGSPRNAHLGAYLVEIQLMPIHEVEELVNKRSNALLMALESGIWPDAEPSFLCNGYCPHQEVCPEGNE